MASPKDWITSSLNRRKIRDSSSPSDLWVLSPIASLSGAARAAHLIGGMPDTPLTCYSLRSYVQSLIRAEQQRRVLKTDTHNYIGTPCTLSARAAHLIGGMSDTPLTCYSLGSYVQSLIRAEQQRRVLKTDTHNYIGTPCTLSARAAHLIGGMSDTLLSCYSLGSYVQSPIRAE